MDKVILSEGAPAYITAPINLDRAIQELQQALDNDLDWLDVVYGRARCYPEKVNQKTVVLPKCYYGGKEYANVLLNDNHNVTAWFQVMTPETVQDPAPMNEFQIHTVTIALIVWFQDLQKLRFTLGDAEDFYHIEHPKREIHNVLNRYPNVSIIRTYDEHARDIFREYTTEVEKEQFLTHPKAGLRFEFILTYNYGSVECPNP